MHLLVHSLYFNIFNEFGAFRKSVLPTTCTSVTLSSVRNLRHLSIYHGVQFNYPSLPWRSSTDLALVLASGVEADVAQEDVGLGREVGQSDPRHQEDGEGRRLLGNVS